MKAHPCPPPASSAGPAPINGGTGAPLAEATAYFQTAAERLAMLPDADDPAATMALLTQHYGIDALLHPLSSEVERTYEARIPGGQQFILKTSSRPAALESFRFQSAVLAGLHHADGVLVPEAIRTLCGDLMFEHQGHGGYLQTRIAGVPLHEAPRNPILLHSVGKALGRLNRALALLRPPAAQRPVLWNITCWTGLDQLYPYLRPGPTADLVRRAMADYRARIAPRLGKLDWQVTHNDPSPFNMIETGTGIAFIDFGDGGWNPRIQDLAIAAGHFATDPGSALGGAEHVIAGYAAVCPLSDTEAALLPGLMRARHAALVLINHWRANLFPESAAYILKNVHRAEQALALLSPLDPASEKAAVVAAAALPFP